MNTSPSKARVWIFTAAAAAGLAVGAAGIAGAATSATSATSTTTAPAASSSQAPPQHPAGQDPAKMTNGPGETLLTGDTAEKVKAAALSAVPGGTIIRVETDSAGAAYEAHMTKSDGTQVTVKLDSSYNVTNTENGFGAGPAHQGAPANGQSGN